MSGPAFSRGGKNRESEGAIKPLNGWCNMSGDSEKNPFHNKVGKAFAEQGRGNSAFVQTGLFRNLLNEQEGFGGQFYPDLFGLFGTFQVLRSLDKDIREFIVRFIAHGVPPICLDATGSHSVPCRIPRIGNSALEMRDAVHLHGSTEFCNRRT